MRIRMIFLTQSNLLKTKITTNNDSVWLPLKGADPSLKNCIVWRTKDEVKGLLSCLYDPQEKVIYQKV